MTPSSGSLCANGEMEDRHAKPRASGCKEGGEGSNAGSNWGTTFTWAALGRFLEHRYFRNYLRANRKPVWEEREECFSQREHHVSEF